jgi:uncharacterized Zn finger protein (UPF0148 family)
MSKTCPKCGSNLYPSRVDDGDAECMTCGKVVYFNVLPDPQADRSRQKPRLKNASTPD